MRRAAAVVVTALVLVGAHATSASAMSKIETRINNVQATLVGSNVTSVFGGLKTKTVCKPGRLVTVYYGVSRNASHSEYGHDSTDSNGDWGIGGVVPDTSHFIIKVSKLDLGSKTCLGDKVSGTF